MAVNLLFPTLYLTCSKMGKRIRINFDDLYLLMYSDLRILGHQNHTSLQNPHFLPVWVNLACFKAQRYQM